MRRLMVWAKELHVGQLIILFVVVTLCATGLHLDGRRRVALAEMAERAFSRAANSHPCNEGPVESQQRCYDIQAELFRHETERKNLGRGEQAVAVLLILLTLSITWVWLEGRKSKERMMQ